MAAAGLVGGKDFDRKGDGGSVATLPDSTVGVSVGHSHLRPQSDFRSLERPLFSKRFLLQIYTERQSHNSITEAVFPLKQCNYLGP